MATDGHRFSQMDGGVMATDTHRFSQMGGEGVATDGHILPFGYAQGRRQAQDVVLRIVGRGLQTPTRDCEGLKTLAYVDSGRLMLGLRGQVADRLKPVPRGCA